MCLIRPLVWTHNSQSDSETESNFHLQLHPCTRCSMEHPHWSTLGCTSATVATRLGILLATKHKTRCGLLFSVWLFRCLVNMFFKQTRRIYCTVFPLLEKSAHLFLVSSPPGQPHDNVSTPATIRIDLAFLMSSSSCSFSCKSLCFWSHRSFCSSCRDTRKRFFLL